MGTIERKTIKIGSRFNKRSGLIASFSDDLPGLLVVGRDAREIEDKLPGAIREILEAQGHNVLSVSLSSDDVLPSWSESPPYFTAGAEFRAAA